MKSIEQTSKFTEVSKYLFANYHKHKARMNKQ